MAEKIGTPHNALQSRAVRLRVRLVARDAKEKNQSIKT